ncbi:transporter [Aspergillus sclerotialis]|uniref:Transporter n=1 Tax=Aspergillus sclerotialis TaxID=2070753 RepID=A0A3A2ZKX3_9EURO|nr:transporter [Aspergillus sclerotialis]
MLTIRIEEVALSLDSQQHLPETIHGQSRSSSTSSQQALSKTVVTFSPNDKGHPANWSKALRCFVLVTGAVQVMNSTVGSSITGGAIDQISQEFNITNQEILVLPISVYLIGYILGPMLWGPASEAYGRKLPLRVAFVTFTIFMMACALANSYPSLLVFRLIDGMAASAPIAVVGGVYADLYSDPTARGRLMAYYMAATTVGPILGPLISGFIATVGWRWCFWFGLIFAGVTLPLALLIPETYAPIILQERAKALRKETRNTNIVSPRDLDERGLKQTLAINLSRPFHMLVREPIVLLSCLYIALAFSIFYLYFQAYPIIFEGIYDMSPGYNGLCFLPIGIGSLIACLIFIWYDNFLASAKARHYKWAYIEEYRRLPLACIGGPLYVLSLLWIGWTASPKIHWAVPLLSGIPFGTGYLLIFMAMMNYLTDAYETYSASALSASTCTRSTFGTLLPLATKPMFHRLGVHWACTLIAFLSLGVALIPFAFIKFGERIRENSKFCQELKMMKEGEEKESKVASPSGAGNSESSSTTVTAAVFRAETKIKDLEKQYHG